LADETGTAKNRFITIDPSDYAIGNRAIKVILHALQRPDPPNDPGHPPPNFSAFEDKVRYVGPPSDKPNVGVGTFKAAKLQCDPYYASNWNELGPIHIYGSEIVPSSEYWLQDVPEVTGKPGILRVFKTARWADVVLPFSPPSMTVQPDFADISAIVDGFRGVETPTTFGKPSVQLQPNVPDVDNAINFVDISECVDAFRSFAYPWPGPVSCPGDN
jgi:hypothetical protein